MNDKLIIGSVCNLKNDSQKYMIIGYNVEGYDYEAIKYPNGHVFAQRNIYFNVEDIENVLFYGFKTEESDQFISSLNNSYNYDISDVKEKINEKNGEKDFNSTSVGIDSISAMSKYIFDDNGIVIADNTVKIEKEELESPFVKYEFDENGVVIADNTVTPGIKELDENNEISESYDEFISENNGIHNTLDTDVDSTENKKDFMYENFVNSKVEEPSIFDKYIFDENGIVIADNIVDKKVEEVKSSLDKYIFDENGIVIADNTTKTQNDEGSALPFNKYVFDENGIVIVDNSSVNPVEIEESSKDGEIEFNSDNDIFSNLVVETPTLGKLSFDKNGVVISQE